jgi:RNA polymerase sigma-70 factor (ECF subfamily)
MRDAFVAAAVTVPAVTIVACGGVLVRVGSQSDADVFRAVYPALRRFAAVVRPVGVDADDLVQEALTRTLAIRSLSSLDEPLAYLRTAVVRVAMNTARSRRREEARIRRAAVAVGHDVDAYPSDLAYLLAVAPDARAVLFLTVVEDLTYRDAAQLAGCSEVAARQMASRALRRLRERLGDEFKIGELR